MTRQPFERGRRQLLGAGAALAATTLAGCAGMSAGGPSIGRVVIVGGGYGGATAARYLKLWGGSVDVTLIERQSEFISCPISNLVLGGYKTMADITKGYGGLKAAGVNVVQGEASAIDPAARTVKLADGRSFPYDRLVLSPGIDFMTEQVGGLQAALDGGRVYHAWKAGAIGSSRRDSRSASASSCAINGRRLNDETCTPRSSASAMTFGLAKNSASCFRARCSTGTSIRTSTCQTRLSCIPCLSVA